MSDVLEFALRYPQVSEFTFIGTYNAWQVLGNLFTFLNSIFSESEE